MGGQQQAGGSAARRTVRHVKPVGRKPEQTNPEQTLGHNVGPAVSTVGAVGPLSQQEIMDLYHLSCARRENNSVSETLSLGVFITAVFCMLLHRDVLPFKATL